VVSPVVLATADLFNALKPIGAAYLVGNRRPYLSVRPPPCRDGYEDRPSGLAGWPEGGHFVKRCCSSAEPEDPCSIRGTRPSHVALQFAVLGFASVALKTTADVTVAFAAGSIRNGATAHSTLIRGPRSAQANHAASITIPLASKP
jgi:hypothetical protein